MSVISEYDIEEFNKSRRQLITAFLLFLILIAVGTIGYIILTPASAFDAFYMTIISITTVGYGEIVDLSDNLPARIFTITILLSGMGIALYFMSSLTAFLVEGELNHLLWRRRMQKGIDRLSNHIILVGGGQTAVYVVQELLHAKVPFVIIEKDKEHFDTLQEQYQSSILGLIADGTEDEALIHAGIDRASGLITMLPEDKDNLFVTISAHSLNPTIKIVSKVIHQSSEYKMLRAGASDVICPDSIGGLRMVSQLLRPHAVSFFDNMLSIQDQSVRIEEIPVLCSESIGKSIAQLNLPRRFGNLLVLALRQAGHETSLYNPKDTVLGSGDTLIVMGDIQWIKKARESLSQQ